MSDNDCSAVDVVAKWSQRVQHEKQNYWRSKGGSMVAVNGQEDEDTPT